MAERVLQVLGNADIVDDEAGRLVAEHPVDTGDGLHQPVALHRLVDIHRVHARRVEAGQPHVSHDDELERIVGVLGALGDEFAPHLRPLADMRLIAERIGGRARHHHLDRARFVVVAMPLGPQLHDGLVERDANPAAHADDHALAIERRDPRLEMLHQVLGDEREPLVGADERLDARPFALQSVLLGLGDVLGQLGDLGVDLRLLVLVEFDPRQPALVVDRHGRAVLDRPADVVDVDIVAEHRGRVGVLLLDRRPGEADERGVGQTVAQIFGEAVGDLSGPPVDLARRSRIGCGALRRR